MCQLSPISVCHVDLELSYFSYRNIKPQLDFLWLYLQYAYPVFLLNCYVSIRVFPHTCNICPYIFRVIRVTGIKDQRFLLSDVKNLLRHIGEQDDLKFTIQDGKGKGVGKAHGEGVETGLN